VPITRLVIYKADYGPNGLRLWVDPTVRIFLGAVTLGALFVFWFEFEPMLTFRAVDALVVGSDVAMMELEVGTRAPQYYREYQSEIFYRYEVAGVPRMGRKYSRMDLIDSPAAAELQTRSTPRGKVVQAWYNPLKPDEAVLTRDPDVRMLVFTCFALFTCWLASSRRMLRAPSPTPVAPAAPLE